MHLHLRHEVVIPGGQLHEQKIVRHLEGGMDFGSVEKLVEGQELIADVFAGGLQQGADLFAHRVRGGLKQLGDAVAHQRRGGHHRDPQLAAQRPAADMHALGIGLVHHVEGDEHGAAQHAQFEGEFEMAIQRRGIHHLDDQVRWGIGGRRGRRLMGRDGGRPVTP